MSEVTQPPPNPIAPGPRPKLSATAIAVILLLLVTPPLLVMAATRIPEYGTPFLAILFLLAPATSAVICRLLYARYRQPFWNPFMKFTMAFLFFVSAYGVTAALCCGGCVFSVAGRL